MKIEKIKRGVIALLVLCMVFPYQYLQATSIGDLMQSFGVDKAVSGTYGYANGIMVQKIDANGNKILFDRGQFRAVIDKNGNLLSLAVYGTDNVSSPDVLKKLVSSVTGLTGTDLDNLFKGINDNGESVSVPTWLGEAVSWLNKGVNYSITIGFSDAGGPSVTFAKDGKEQYAKNFLGVKTSEWTYNKDGSLAKVSSLSYEHCTKDTPGAIEKTDSQGNKYYVKEVYTETIYKNGLASEVYEISKDGTRNLVGKYEYNSAGEILSYTDYKNSQKMLYSGGKPFYAISLGGNIEVPSTINEGATEVGAGEALQNNALKSGYFKVTQEDGTVKYYKLKTGYQYDSQTGRVSKVGDQIAYGTVVTIWNYHANGALDTVESRDKAGAWSTTVFDAGRAVAVFNGRYANGGALRNYVNQIMTLAEQAANGSTSALQQLSNMHDTNVYGLKALYLYNDQIKNWLSKYSDAKVAEIICRMFNWTDGQFGGAAAVNTALSIINTVKSFGFNGSNLATVATFTNTLSQTDNNNASFVGSVTLYAAGQAVVDLNTSALDRSYDDLINNAAGGVIDWQGLYNQFNSGQLSLSQMLNMLFMTALESQLVAQYAKALEDSGLTKGSDGYNSKIAAFRKAFREAFVAGNYGIDSTAGNIRTFIQSFMGGQITALGGDFVNTTGEKYTTFMTNLMDKVFTSSYVTDLAKSYKDKRSEYEKLLPIIQKLAQGKSLSLAELTSLTSNLSNFMGDVAVYFQTQIEFISGLNDLIPDDWRIAFGWWDYLLNGYDRNGDGNFDVADDSKPMDPADVVKILTNIIKAFPELFGGSQSANNLIATLEGLKNDKSGLLNFLKNNQYFKKTSETGNNTRISDAIRNRLNSITDAVEKIFKFKIERVWNSGNLNGAIKHNNDDVDTTTDVGWNVGLNNAWKSAMKDILRSLNTQLTTRIMAIADCIRSGNLLGMKDLNQKITPTAENTYKYSHDPSIAGTLQNIVNIDGKYYAVVSADYIDIMDGLGAQDAGGELIYVEISAELAAQIQDKIGGSVMFMGDVAADTNGHLTITMNVSYGAGYRDLGNMKPEQMKNVMDSLKNEAWYGKVLDSMKSVWSDIKAQYGGYSTWRQGFEFLRNYATGGGSVANF